jgi:hypothetical protein
MAYGDYYTSYNSPFNSTKAYEETLELIQLRREKRERQAKDEKRELQLKRLFATAASLFLFCSIPFLLGVGTNCKAMNSPCPDFINYWLGGGFILLVGGLTTIILGIGVYFLYKLFTEVVWDFFNL